MIQTLLTLLGFLFPHNNLNTTYTSQDITASQSAELGEGIDTGGETTPLPPKK
ncbi:hypothetical protein [Chryseobacterium sp. StRB126]|uniref:hypothetical protein n=1 Tax=Chryseobacterium sp. StRB126 TaxID=878220 RepID=UPI000B03903F|nr:hypothetical protein [Chryseobacterium sp. StRB126]